MFAYQTNSKTNARYRFHTWLFWLSGLAALASGAPAAVALDCACESPFVVEPGEVCTLTADCTVDVLIILPGGTLRTGAHTLTVTQSSGLVIFPSGNLFAQPGGALRLTGGGTPKIDGVIFLWGTLEIADNDVTLKGDGWITGEIAGALVLINDALTLTNQITIDGVLQITEPAGGAANTAFVNNGTVRANASGTLEISIDSLGISAGRWEVGTNSSAVLKLNHGSSVRTHSGDFTVADGATLDVNETVTTTGDLTFTSGTLRVAAGESFTAGRSHP